MGYQVRKSIPLIIFRGDTVSGAGQGMQIR
jgi:hypothetical protein